MKFQTREEAGTKLAVKLKQQVDLNDATVIVLRPEGTPVAFEVAEQLNLPLDLFLVRRLGLPGCPDIAIGAVASGGVKVLNNTASLLRVPYEVIESAANRELRELERFEKLYRHEGHRLLVANRTVVLIDDGVTDGLSIAAAVAALRQHTPVRVIVAAPVISRDDLDEFQSEVDGVVTVLPPVSCAAERWYEHLPKVSDKEAIDLIGKLHELRASA